MKNDTYQMSLKLPVTESLKDMNVNIIYVKLRKSFFCFVLFFKYKQHIKKIFVYQFHHVI